FPSNNVLCSDHSANEISKNSFLFVPLAQASPNTGSMERPKAPTLSCFKNDLLSVIMVKVSNTCVYMFAHPLAKTSTKCMVLTGRLCLSIYPCRCSKHEESVEMIKSASIASAWCTFCSAIALDIASNLTANVPPNPQQVSVCCISTKSNPATLASNCRGSSLMRHSRSPEHES